jgi:DNA replication and repair protein RecF
VDQAPLPVRRRYALALKPRNPLLKRRQADPQLDAWEDELAQAGEAIGAQRMAYVDALQPQLALALDRLLPVAGGGTLAYLPGWRRDECSLRDALLLARERDLAAGFTSVGPHRADWRIDFGAIPGRQALSRGQAKLVALSLLLAQAEHHAGVRGEWPVVAFDDLASELDRTHQRRVLERLLATGAQVFITGTEVPAALGGLQAPLVMFHVEHGQLQAEARPSPGGPPATFHG